MHQINRSVLVDADLDKVWQFIETPENLNLITPDELQFTIKSVVPDEMYNGLLIEYRIKIPIIGTQKWVTEIKHIRPLISFVDEQRIGPYKLWYHYHEIKKEGEQVRIIDQVSYKVPFGILGKLLEKLFIRRTLNRVFNYREDMFLKLLNRDS